MTKKKVSKWKLALISITLFIVWFSLIFGSFVMLLWWWKVNSEEIESNDTNTTSTELNIEPSKDALVLTWAVAQMPEQPDIQWLIDWIDLTNISEDEVIDENASVEWNQDLTTQSWLSTEEIEQIKAEWIEELSKVEVINELWINPTTLYNFWFDVNNLWSLDEITEISNQNIQLQERPEYSTIVKPIRDSIESKLNK